MIGPLTALRRLRDQSWLSLDTETTGLGPYDVVIEIALLEADGTVLADSTVQPERPIPRKATRVHGLDAHRLADAPSWPSLWAHLQGHVRNRPVVAWNAAFDLRMLRQTCARHRVPLSVRQIVCLQQAFQHRHPVVRPTLAAACLALGIAERPNHRARVDAEVARQVAWKLLEDAPAATPG